MAFRCSTVPGPYGLEPCFHECFSSSASMISRGWTLYNAPTFGSSGSMTLNGTTQYASIPVSRLSNMPYRGIPAGEMTIAIEFTPAFAPNDGVAHVFCDFDDNAAGNRTVVYHETDNSLRVYTGATTLVLTAAYAAYSAIWLPLQKNLLVVGIASGSEWWSLNGSTFVTGAVAFVPQILRRLFAGADVVGAQRFSGTLHNLMLFNRKLTQAEVTSLWQNGSL